MSTRQTMVGSFYRGVGVTVAYLATKQPYSAQGVEATIRRSERVLQGGTPLILRLHENKAHPAWQCFILDLQGIALDNRRFELVVQDIFTDRVLSCRWVSGPIETDRVLAALIQRAFEDD